MDRSLRMLLYALISLVMCWWLGGNPHVLFISFVIGDVHITLGQIDKSYRKILKAWSKTLMDKDDEP